MREYSADHAFRQRALDIEIADKMGCRFDNGKFLFDYTNQDVLVSRKVRTLDKKFWFEPKGQPLQLWNIDGIRGLGSRPKEPLVITEGEFDAIAVNQACGGYVVSVPNGGDSKRSEGLIYPEKDQGFRYIWQDRKILPEIEQFDKIILATDDDETGILLREELAIRIGETRCWFVVYPENCKDANDVLKYYGGETLAKVIANAKPMRPGYLAKPSELPERRISTYSTGWCELDRRIMLTRPELLVVTGIPGHGKGQFIRALTLRLAMAHGWRTAFLTPEDPYERARRDMRRFCKFHFPEAKQDEWIDRHFRFSQPPEDEKITMQTVMTEMESAAFHHDCQAFVLDPWNEISHDRKGRSETEYVEDSLIDLKRKARRLKQLLIVAAHPRKVDGKPDLYDISGSSNWFNKCDHGIIIYRSTPDDDFAQVIIGKCKDHETMGTPGKTVMTFNRNTADFSVNEV